MSYSVSVAERNVPRVFPQLRDAQRVSPAKPKQQCREPSAGPTREHSEAAARVELSMATAPIWVSPRRRSRWPTRGCVAGHCWPEPVSADSQHGACTTDFHAGRVRRSHFPASNLDLYDGGRKLVPMSTAKCPTRFTLADGGQHDLRAITTNHMNGCASS